MKYIRKIRINGFKACCNILCSLCVCLFISSPCGAQSPPPGWVEISLVDTIPYVQFGTDHIADKRYPPSACFDADIATCWVCGTTGTDTSSLYLRLPERDNLVVNLFAGYGKNKKLYEMNARPKSIRLSVFAAVNPEGFVSENAVLYKAMRFSETRTVHISGGFGVQSMPLDFAPQDVAEFKNRVFRQYDKNFKIPRADSCLILKIEMMDIRPGSRYKDICISEIYFNDCLLSPEAKRRSPVKSVYLNRAENELLVDDADDRGISVYRDMASVLQIVDISPDNRWAVVISMPAEIEGRAETTYLLFNLLSRKQMGSLLEKQTGNYLSGNEMYMKTTEQGRVYLHYSGTDFEFHNVELR
ncbi:MAG: hypothetical protein JXR85_08330 [Deltaproteobacteria bacterium]|nr:hypothetical protein [Deltaproteobacteria bacterium]